MLNNTIDFSLSKDDTLILKGFAICAMLWHHLFLYSPKDIVIHNNMLTEDFAILGKICVTIFFMLSGYGLSQNYKQNEISIKGTLLFTIRRLLKFYSSYWFVFLLFVPCSILFFDRSLEIAYNSSICNLYISLLLDFFALSWTPFNGTWWFNTYILIFYLCFPIFFWVGKKIPIITIIGAFLLIDFGDYIHIAYRGFNRWIFAFYAGIIYNLYITKINFFFSKFKKHKVGLISSILLIILCFIRINYDYKTADNLILICLLILFQLYGKNKGLKFLKILGKHSINIYLIHTFIFSYWPSRNLIYFCNNSIITFLTLLFSCLLISYLIDRIKEICGYNKTIQKVLSTSFLNTHI